MFGDKPIFGNKTIKIDNKNRCIIPKFTGIEEGESLSLVKRDDFYFLYSTEQISSIINDLEANIARMPKGEKYEELKQAYINYCCSIIKSGEVDVQNRFNLSDCDAFQDEVVCVGAGNKILLLTPEQFANYKSKK